MPSVSNLALAAAAVTQASAAFQGFNYGATFTSGAIKQQSDYEAEFTAAQKLPGTNGAFNSARLYTTIQGDTPSNPISAIPAAIKTKTSLLLGLWASAGDFAFNNEVSALKSAISQYCNQGFGDLVVGISVGSEDLYRISPTGIKAKEGAGASPQTLAGYVSKVRDTIKGSCIKDAPIGHVDTWTAYVNGSNNPLIEAVDWLGMDAYPYFQSTMANSISDGKGLFQEAFDNTKGASMGKPVWITETGWPVSGKQSGAAEASTKNAQAYWDEVGCPLFGQVNTWWYVLQDAAPTTPNPSFGVVADLNGKPLYDLSCKDAPKQTSSSKTGSTSTKPSSSHSTTAKTDDSTTTAEATSAQATDTKESTTGASSTTSEGSSSSSAPTTMASPTQTSDSSSGSGSGSDSGSGSSSDSGSSTTSAPASATSSDPASAGSQLNSIAAAALAFAVAAAAL